MIDSVLSRSLEQKRLGSPGIDYLDNVSSVSDKFFLSQTKLQTNISCNNPRNLLSRVRRDRKKVKPNGI